MASVLIEKDIYNGDLHITHNPNARGRQPRYVVTKYPGTEDEVISKPRGVTTILGQTLFKDLIGWALGSMAEYLEAKLPVITQEDLEEAKKESTRRRDKGANTGTEAHAMVENYLKGLPVTLGSKEANNAFGAFIKWFEQATPIVISVEEVIYSNILGYAGTFDCLLEVDGKVYLADFKTTNSSRNAPNGVYPENFVQLGAYALAYEEQRLYEEANGGTDLVKIDGLMVISGKKNGKLDIVTNEDVGLTVEDCQSAFEMVLAIHGFITTVTGRLKNG